jgi:hypothetical protein
MKHKLLSMAVLCGLVGPIGSAQAASPPLASVACTSGVTGCAFALDGQFPPERQWWQQDTAWWNGLSDSVIYTLDGPVMISGLTVSLDNNDSYVIEASTNGNDWQTLMFVGASSGTVGFGMDTFSSFAAHPQFDSSSVFTAAMASQIRITAVDGDTQNSVGELQVTAIPEPSLALLLALGIPAMLMLKCRRAGQAPGGQHAAHQALV